MASFDPKKHLVKLQGADYLPVAYRLVWFREEWPHGVITTELIDLENGRAIVRATAMKVDEAGTIKGSATGTKAQTEKQFPRGHIEKAETGAIGRALAALGYGTQFEPEFDEGDMLADAPVERPAAPQRAQPANGSADTRDKQVKRLHAVGKTHGLDHDALRVLVLAKCHKEGIEAASTKDAPGSIIAAVADALDANPQPLVAFATKKLAEQAELMPDERTVPNPHHA